jgi:hypothetical protein
MRTPMISLLTLALSVALVACGVQRPASRVRSAPADVPALPDAPGDDSDVWRRPHAQPRKPAGTPSDVDVWTTPHARKGADTGGTFAFPDDDRDDYDDRDARDDDRRGDGERRAPSNLDGERADDALDAAAAAVPAPPIGEVLAAAYAEAGLDHDPTPGWSRRARLAGLVPLVAVRAGRNTKWEELEPDVGYGVTYEVRATWRLDRLVFDGREMQAASQQAARRRERSQLVGRVLGLYFAYRRAVASGLALRAEEAAVELDALTGGYFLGALAP